MTERLHDFRNKLLVGDVVYQLRRLPSQSVHLVVTSPPYYRIRDYGHPGQIGLEPTGEEYLAKLVSVFREVRRVLRTDGSMYVNMSDSWVGGGRGKDVGSTLEGSRDSQTESRKVAPGKGVFGLKEKQLIGMPWRLALALQADCWWLREDNIWEKKNIMPQSADDRTTRSHEYVFHFARALRYFYDAIAVEEPQSENERARRLKQQAKGNRTVYKLKRDALSGQPPQGANGAALAMKGTRTLRSVWRISTGKYRDPAGSGLHKRHFAIFPEQLVKLLVLSGTSERGVCSLCGAPWRRLVRPTESYRELLEANLGRNHNKDRAEDLRTGRYGTGLARFHNILPDYRTVGWERSCRCLLGEAVPAVVLDPFMGSGTTAVACERLGRDWVGIELVPEYAAGALRRIERAKEKRAREAERVQRRETAPAQS